MESGPGGDTRNPDRIGIDDDMIRRLFDDKYGDGAYEKMLEAAK